MATDTFDWTQIKAIRYSFEKHSLPRCKKTHEAMNARISDELFPEDYASIFIDNPVTPETTLAPSAVSLLKIAIADSVNESVSNTPSFLNDPTHINTLITGSALRFQSTPSTTVSIRSNARLIDIAKKSIQQGTDIIDILVEISHWHFNLSVWIPSNFDAVATTEFHRDEESQADNTGNQTVAQTLLEVTNMLKQMQQNQQERPAAAGPPTAATQGQQRANSTARTHTGPEIPWNPLALPTQVRTRNAQQATGEIFTSKELSAYDIQIQKADGTTVTQPTNYYLDPPGVGPRLITRDGMCFDFTRNPQESSASREKTFLTHFPKLNSSTPSEVCRWYADVVKYGRDKGVHIHPYFLFRKDAQHLRGFAIGDDPMDDLPSRCMLTVNEWSSWLCTALRTDKIASESCARERATVRSYYGGNGYEVLHSLIRIHHPNTLRHPHDLISSAPTQAKTESLQEYYFRCTDYLQLKAYLADHKTSMGSKSEISTFIQGSIYCDELRRKTDEERESTDKTKQAKYKHGAILGTLEVYYAEILSEKNSRRPQVPLPSALRHRGIPPGRNSGRSLRSRTTDTSSLTTARISLIDALGLPSPPESSTATEALVNNAYCQAVHQIDSEPRKFDTTRECVVCRGVGHSFDKCPMLNDFDYLKRHRIAIAQFIRQQERSRDQWHKTNDANISQVETETSEEWQHLEQEPDASTEQETQDFQQG